MKQPLKGFRVLEWGIFHAGPGGPAILADMGAEVIKIERPGIGDPSRHSYAYKGIDFNFGKDRNIFYEAANRGKKSITLNLAHDEGKRIAHGLVSKCDVFFTNIRPHTVKRLQMDYSTLKAIKPDIIYASVTSYGSRGPDANRGGFDYQGQGKSGLMFNMGEPGMPPVVAQFALIDQSTAIMASYQVVIALLMRERFGLGQEVDVSLLSTAAYMMYINNLTALLTGREIPRHGQSSADPMRNYYQCKDGKWVITTQVPMQGKWKVMCELLGLPQLAEDSRYDTREKRLARSEELVSIFNQAFLSKTRDEWVQLFGEKDLVMCPVYSTLEALRDPQMAANDYVVDYDHPEIGRIRIPGFPIHFSQAEIKTNFLGPKLGEHTDMVLEELGNYSKEEIERFRKENII